MASLGVVLVVVVLVFVVVVVTTFEAAERRRREGRRWLQLVVKEVVDGGVVRGTCRFKVWDYLKMLRGVKQWYAAPVAEHWSKHKVL